MQILSLEERKALFEIEADEISAFFLPEVFWDLAGRANVSVNGAFVLGCEPARWKVSLIRSMGFTF